jgi:phenylalanyl-tRNA synthetase beta chain
VATGNPGPGRRFNFSTDAGHRFERGVDFENIVEHIERISALIVEICGGREQVKLGPVDDQIINLPQRLPVKLRTARAQKVIGALTDEVIADIFKRLDCNLRSRQVNSW